MLYNKCPQDHEFGRDHGLFDECDHCPTELYNECAAIQIESEDNFKIDIEQTSENKKGTTNKRKDVYKSKKGFVNMKVLRGFTEIEGLYMLLRAYQGQAYICGGYVRYMCSKRYDVTPAQDVDVYCVNKEIFKSLNKLLTSTLTIKHENEISITYNHCEDEESDLYGCPTIQLIKPVKEGKIVTVGQMKDVLENFDFTVVRAGLLSPRMAMVDADFEHDETIKKLRIKNIHCPVSSVFRIVKYNRKGYFANINEIVKLFWDWEARNPEYKERIMEFVKKIDDGDELTKKQIDEFEELMRID